MRRPGRIGLWMGLIIAAVGAAGLVIAALMAWMLFSEEKSNGPFPNIEFRIVANDKDDSEALNAVMDYFQQADDPKRKAELQQRAEAGEPPPYPETAPAGPGYAWVEIGPTELRTLYIDDTAETRPGAPTALDEMTNRLREMADDARERNRPFVHPAGLLYSRVCQNQRLTAAERTQKKVDAFFLTRLPEKGRELTGELLRVVKVASDSQGKPCLSIEFTKEGGDRMFEVSSANKDHSLALIIGAKIVSAPSLKASFHEKAQITGQFTRAELDAIVTAIRSAPASP